MTSHGRIKYSIIFNDEIQKNAFNNNHSLVSTNSAFFTIITPHEDIIINVDSTSEVKGIIDISVSFSEPAPGFNTLGFTPQTWIDNEKLPPYNTAEPRRILDLSNIQTINIIDISGIPIT